MLALITGALVIGITLGLLGSGGSTIAVPVLIYFIGHGPKEAIAESMAIVGVISAAAAISYARSRLIHWSSVWYFGIAGMLGTSVGATLGGIAPESLQLIVFGAVMLLAALLMFRNAKMVNGEDENATSAILPAVWKVFVLGGLVGVVTGFVGVGGGFLIVPALVLFSRLPMRTAIGTSLVIITLNATVGFLKYQHFLITHSLSVDFPTVLSFATIGIAGSMLGKRLNSMVNTETLTRVFATFLVVLGATMIVHEGGKFFSDKTEQARVNPLPSGIGGIHPAAHAGNQQREEFAQCY